MLPQEAILQAPEGHFVYTLNKANEVAIKKVTMGEWFDNKWVVLQGLEKDDKVIIDNLLKIKPGIKVQPTIQLPQVEARN